ncbi:MAG: DEAD/DEAH box helicase, partial [Planctomycetia bacterium]
MPFADLHLIDPLLRALAEEGYTSPTEIQRQAIPHVLAGRDLLGIAQTGTGKTAAFALPVLQLLSTRPARLPPGSGRPPVRALVIAPTRELAAQVADSFRSYGRHLPLRGTVIYGGVGQVPQVQALTRGVDILVATPGRLLDLLQQGCVRLGGVEVVVLDEADRMLDMGFLPDVQRILSVLPKPRQTLVFSATMAGAPAQLAASILRDPARVEVTPQATTVERIRQSVIYLPKPAKQPMLERLLGDPAFRRTLVFTRTKHGANKVVSRLAGAGIQAAALHADKSQGQRQRALAAFREGRLRVLVATDIAARGIDVEGITHVVNFDLPNVPDSYVHRIGRTARAGAEGAAISFCDPTERADLRDIEREIRMRVPTHEGHGEPPRVEDLPAPHGAPHVGPHGDSRGPQRGPRRGQGGRQGGGHGGGHGGGQGGGHGARHGGGPRALEDGRDGRGRRAVAAPFIATAAFAARPGRARPAARAPPRAPPRAGPVSA